jgi:hypothetical protein
MSPSRIFLFSAEREAIHAWALRDSPSLFDSNIRRPVQVTAGATSFWNPVPGKDGKQIFAYGGQSRGELVRYGRAVCAIRFSNISNNWNGERPVTPSIDET